MIRDQKRNKRIYKGLLEDLIYYLKKIDSNEFDLFSKSNEFEKYYPILTELNLNFIFSHFMIFHQDFLTPEHVLHMAINLVRSTLAEGYKASKADLIFFKVR